jgi:putative inorganic carbon (HCO3(-)) transporter
VSASDRRPVLAWPLRLLIRWEPILVLLALPFLLFPNQYSWVAVAIGFVPAVARCIFSRRPVAPTLPGALIAVPIAVLSLLMLVAVGRSPDLSLSLPALFKNLAGLLVFSVVVNQAADYRGLWWASGAILALGFLISFFPVVAMNAMPQKIPVLFDIYTRLPRLVDTGFHANLVGGTLAVLAPVGLAVALIGRERPWLWGGAGVVLTLGALVTQSRGGIIALMCGLVVLGLLATRRFLAALPVIALALLGAGQWAGWDQVRNALVVSETLGTWQGRQDIWAASLQIIRDCPFGGIGLDALPVVLPLYWPLSLRSIGASVTHAHNLLLQVALDVGIPGLIAYLVLTLVLLALAWQSASRARTINRRLYALAVGLFASQLVIMVHGTVDVVFWNHRPAFIFWALAGLIVALHRLLSQSTEISLSPAVPAPAK